MEHVNTSALVSHSSHFSDFQVQHVGSDPLKLHHHHLPTKYPNFKAFDLHIYGLFTWMVLNDAYW